MYMHACTYMYTHTYINSCPHSCIHATLEYILCTHTHVTETHTYALIDL